MKKITILAVAALAISFASCKKDRTCECKTTSTITGTTTGSTTIKDTKKKAKEECDKLDSSTEVFGEKVTVECEIK
jgi:hypothetical protein